MNYMNLHTFGIEILELQQWRNNRLKINFDRYKYD